MHVFTTECTNERMNYLFITEQRMKYNFKIIETYSKSVEIEAESENEAFEKIRDSYESGEIKFDAADDFVDWEIYPE